MRTARSLMWISGVMTVLFVVLTGFAPSLLGTSSIFGIQPLLFVTLHATIAFGLLMLPWIVPAN